MSNELKEVRLPEPTQRQWQLVLAEDKPYPRVIGAYLLANGGKRMVKVEDLPERIHSFWCLERDEDDISIWRSTRRRDCAIRPNRCASCRRICRW